MSLVRFVLTDGASIIANLEGSRDAKADRVVEPMITFTADHEVAHIPSRRVEAILPVDGRLPMPRDASIFSFATIG